MDDDVAARMRGTVVLRVDELAADLAAPDIGERLVRVNLLLERAGLLGAANWSFGTFACATSVRAKGLKIGLPPVWSA